MSERVQEGSWEPELVDALDAALVKDPNVDDHPVVDMGVNVGAFIMPVAARNLRVYGFEMQQEVGTPRYSRATALHCWHRCSVQPWRDFPHPRPSA